MDEVFEIEDESTKYFSSSRLMEAVRALDYKQQYKVCEAFFNLMVEEGFGDDSEMCQGVCQGTGSEVNPESWTQLKGSK